MSCFLGSRLVENYPDVRENYSNYCGSVITCDFRSFSVMSNLSPRIISYSIYDHVHSIFIQVILLLAYQEMRNIHFYTRYEQASNWHTFFFTFLWFFTFSSEKVLDLCKMWPPPPPPPRFCQMSTFWDPLNPKKWFSRMCLSGCVCMSVCMSVCLSVDFSLLAR